MSGNRVRASENSGVTGMPVGRRFAPGTSGNPGGRPKGIAATVRENTSPDALVAILLAVAEDPRAKPAERIAAVRELLDRGYGKAPAFAAIEGTNPLELADLARDIQGIADELAARRQTPAEGSRAAQG